MRMEPDEVAATVEPAGLRLLRTVELPPYHYSVFSRNRRPDPSVPVCRSARRMRTAVVSILN
jgi:hypothetical protein